MGTLDVAKNLRWKLAGHGRPLDEVFWEPFRGTRVLEVGGPTKAFAAKDRLPIYPIATAVDGLQWAAETEWHGHQTRGAYIPDGTETGQLYVTEDPDLAEIPTASYGGIICSHVIEHIANPLRALAAWRRVTAPGGLLMIVAPHMEGTFDRRRRVTPLEHLIADRDDGVEEDDLTHLEETLHQHDHARDVERRTEEWEAKRRENSRHRLLHHHVFTTMSLLDLLEYAGLLCSAVTVRWPHDIYVLSRWATPAERALTPQLERRRNALSSSPFRVDRLAALSVAPRPRDP